MEIPTCTPSITLPHPHPTLHRTSFHQVGVPPCTAAELSAESMTVVAWILQPTFNWKIPLAPYWGNQVVHHQAAIPQPMSYTVLAMAVLHLSGISRAKQSNTAMVLLIRLSMPSKPYQQSKGYLLFFIQRKDSDLNLVVVLNSSNINISLYIFFNRQTFQTRPSTA